MERSAEDIARTALKEGKIPPWSIHRDYISFADFVSLVKGLGEHEYDDFTV